MSTTQFDQLAEAYERSFDEALFRRHVEQFSILAALGDLDGARVVELGCGSGVYSRLLARRGAGSVVGIDESSDMIDYARRRETDEPWGVTYEVANITDPYRLSTVDYDLVLAVYVLPYASTAGALLSMCRTAKAALAGTGGRFVAATLNPDFATTPHYYRPDGFDLVTPAGPHRRDGDPVELHSDIGGNHFSVTAYYWSRNALDHALTEAGFEDITWSSPQCSPEADPADFASYLAIPHATLVTAS